MKRWKVRHQQPHALPLLREAPISAHASAQVVQLKPQTLRDMLIQDEQGSL